MVDIGQSRCLHCIVTVVLDNLQVHQNRIIFKVYEHTSCVTIVTRGDHATCANGKCSSPLERPSPQTQSVRSARGRRRYWSGRSWTSPPCGLSVPRRIVLSCASSKRKQVSLCQDYFLLQNVLVLCAPRPFSHFQEIANLAGGLPLGVRCGDLVCAVFLSIY